MPSSNTPVLQYPTILCPLPRRSHSYPYPLPHHRSHHFAPSDQLRHHLPRSRRTPSISVSPRTPSILPTALSPTLVSPSDPTLPSADSDTPLSPHPSPDHIPKADPPCSPILQTDSVPPSGLGPDLESPDSKPPAEDDVLSEFLSLFIPSSPAMAPVTSPCAKASPKHRKFSSVVPGLRPRSRLGPSQADDGSEDQRSHSAAYGAPPSHYNWLIASPISRCHNPLPRHAELDALASRLADPIHGLVLTDRALDEHSEPPMSYFTRTLTGTDFKTQSEASAHRQGSPAMMA